MISINRKAVRAAGGTQSDELQAKIKSVTSSTTVGSCFIYDTRSMDSDGGAWRKKCAGLSWYDEDLNTATRGGRRSFPSVALIVADNATDETLTIYDLDDPAMPVWMVFNVGGSYPAQYMLGETAWGNVHSVYALNGRLYVARNLAGLLEIDFANDHASRYSTDGQHRYGSIANRNADSDDVIRDSSAAIVNGTVNNVAATIVEGSEIGALGLPIPTIAVATGGGLSVIHPNGDVYDKATTSAAATLVEFDKRGNLYVGQGDYINRFDLSTLYADASNPYLSTHENNGTIITIREFANGSNPALLSSTTSLAVTDNGFAAGSAGGLTSVLFNAGNHEESAVAYVTSVYNTGYMLGDTRLATFAVSSITDRSVKGNTLTKSGTINGALVATGAEVYGYSNFSASNYLSRAYDADFDFGTGDFSIMFWCKLADTVNATETVLERAYGGNALFNIDFASGVPRLIAYNGSAFDTTTGTRDLSDNQWHQIMCFRKSGVAYIYIDGKQHVSNAMTYDLDNSQAILHIGQTTGNGNPLVNGSLSLLRISATAPTPQQAKDIYEAEAPLFRAGAKCLLSGADALEDLSYDSSTDLLTTAGNQNNIFRGLERVDTFNGQTHSDWNSTSSHFVASNGGVSSYVRAYGTGGVIVDLPPFDVRGDTNIADSKSSNDGKLHFSGVTVNATPTVIGQIPIAENESYTVIARVMGLRYNTADSSVRHFCEIKQQFTRRVGGDVVEETQISKLEEGDWAALDVDLDYDTGADTIRVKVTGDGSGPYRVGWNATVEVQRISEKTYER